MISVLYGLSLEHVLDLGRSCADTSGGRLRIRLNGDLVKVDEPVAQVWDVRDSRLFPGRLRGDRFSVGGVHYYLREVPAS